MFVIIFAVISFQPKGGEQTTYLMGFLLNWHRKTTEKVEPGCRVWGEANFRILENLNGDADRHTVEYIERVIHGGRKNLLNKLKKALAIYSQFEAYQFHSAFETYT